MDHHYDIPAVRYRADRRLPIAATCLAILTVWALYRAESVYRVMTGGGDKATLVWLCLFAVSAQQTILAWTDRPYTATPEERAELARHPVVVVVPLYNEDPAVVDRVLYALSRQTRLPDSIWVVDDGSDVDYTPVRDRWGKQLPTAVDFRWVRRPNAKKRRAQAWWFAQLPADAFVVTLDSDTALEAQAIEQGLLPFADPQVMSVAGIELAMNGHTNLLTRMASMRQLAWQLGTCCALNRRGQILVNRGIFALYRAEVILDNLDAYLAETFAGAPVHYSDDSWLTLAALRRGKAVQQLTAFGLAMYPDRASHQLRQWQRWMRGSTIRSLWRAKYLPVTSYGWWMNLLSWWQFVVSYAAYAWITVLWAGGHFSTVPVIMGLLVAYLSNVRNLLIWRSDETPRQQCDQFLIAPVSWLWSLTILRALRLYAMATCGNNTWGTRAAVEVKADPATPAPPVPSEFDDTLVLTAAGRQP